MDEVTSFTSSFQVFFAKPAIILDLLYLRHARSCLQSWFKILVSISANGF